MKSKSMKKLKNMFKKKKSDDTANMGPLAKIEDVSDDDDNTESTMVEDVPLDLPTDLLPSLKEEEYPPVPKAKIFIVFYSLYGHVYKMAQAVKAGVDSMEGCEGVLYQVAETLPKNALLKMNAPPKPDVPVIDPNDLAQADGILFGFPTRFGMMATQMKAMFDATGGLWKEGALVGKPAGMFTCTGTQGGGQETTIMTAVCQLVHHGMVFVPLGYTFGSDFFSNMTARGGGPWGAGCLSGADGSRQPSDFELTVAKHQGSHFAKTARKLAKE